MRNRGRELPERRDAVDVREIGLRAGERLLRALAFGDVEDADQHAVHGGGLGREGDRKQDVEPLALQCL